MAKQYEEFKKDFATIEAQVSAAQSEIKKNANALSQTSGIMREGVKEIGLRVQALKNAGDKGTKVSDFMFDSQVKAMMNSINAYMKQIEAECKRIDALAKGSFTKTKNLFWDTKKALTAEIASRKKQASTKLGTGNKSLADMEKLLTDMNKFANGAFTTFDAFVPETTDDHQRSLDNWLKDEMGKTKDVALSSFQKEMDEQACNTRVLKGNVANAKTMLAAVDAQAAAGDEAFKAKQLKPLMDAKLAVVKHIKELADMAGKYDRAKADQWVMSNINSSKDKAAILAGMKAIADMRDQAKAAVSKLATLKL